MEIKVRVEKIEAKVVICPICDKEITNMRSEYCPHLLRWNDGYAYFGLTNEINYYNGFVEWHNKRTLNGIDEPEECQCNLKDEWRKTKEVGE